MKSVFVQGLRITLFFTVLFSVNILLHSCSLQKVCAGRYPCQGSADTVYRDSICYIPHDSLIQIPADSSAITALLACADENGKLTRDKVKLMEIVSYKAGNRVGVPNFVIRDNYVEVKCKVDTLDIIHRWLEKHVNRYVKISKTTVQKVYTLTWMDGLWKRIGIGAVIIVGLLIIYLIARTWLSSYLPFLKK